MIVADPVVRGFAAAALAAAMPFAGARAGVIEDFPFDDPDGTLLQDAANTANPGNLWGVDTADMTETQVEGGSLLIRKANEEFGTNFLDIDNITSGTVYLVAELGGWEINPVNPAEPEQLRFAFLTNDTNEQGGSTIAAQMQLRLITPTLLQLEGTANGAATSIAENAFFDLSHPDPFTLVLEFNKDDDLFQVYYKDGDADFVALGSSPGELDPDRDGNSIRFVANNSFGDPDEFVSIDRIFLTDQNPLLGPPDLVGDLNGDGFVGAGDLDILLGVWNQNDSGAADLNEDGFIGAGDLDILLGNWNAGTAPGGLTAVPEPATALCVALGGIGLFRRRRGA